MEHRDAGRDPNATGTDALADGAEVYDPLRSGLDDVGTTRDDAACVVPWVADGFQAIEVFVDPAVDDRIASICELATEWSQRHRDVDGLTAAIMDYADGEGLSASIYPEPEGDLSAGVLAVAITAG